MGHPLTKEISQALKAMEQGAFQEFCLYFLPLFNPLYKGLRRHGGTADGKTRKGTPDLIKTLSNGKQIAVQCSVEENYWKIPKDKRNWKPCRDMDACIKSVSDLQEIVLCSSQEIPTNAPNTESEAIRYAKGKTGAKITPLSCADIEKPLTDNIGNPLFGSLFHVHFPEISRRIESLKEDQRNRLAIELNKERAAPPDEILRIATEAIATCAGVNDEKVYALKRIDELRSRFERDHPPDPGDVVRHVSKDSSLLRPIGSIQALLGVPKVGKTLLLAQCATYWKSGNINIHWFDCPIDERESRLFVQDISRSLCSCFMPTDKVWEFISGAISLQSIDFRGLKYIPDRPIVYVLDNAEILSTNNLRLLNVLLSKLRSCGLLCQVGLILVSNKGLKNILSAISQEFLAPAWTKKELKDLLSLRVPENIYCKDDKYLEVLATMSSGHPLVALALARKYPSIDQLVVSMFKAPSLADEDLAADVNTFLFEDMLTDTDYLNFVLRLSVLTYRAKDKVLHALTNKVHPIIATPFKLLLGKLYGTVIEGDQSQGYGVSFIYKQVAKSQVDQLTQREIYDVVSTELLKPEGKTLDANEITDGILYALLANKLERSFYWTIALLQSAINKNLPKPQIRSICTRIEFMAFLNSPADPQLLSMYCACLYSMALAYMRTEQYRKAADALEKLEMPDVKLKDKELETKVTVSKEIGRVFKMVMVANEDPIESVNIMSCIDFQKIKKSPFKDMLRITEFLRRLIRKLSFKELPKGILEKIIHMADLNDPKEFANLMGIALDLGVKADRENLKIKEVADFLPSDGPIIEAVISMVKAQYSLQKQQLQDSLEFVQQAITLFRESGIWSDPVESIIRQTQGDIYYNLNAFESARSAYSRCLECLEDDTGTFDYAWAIYRLGLLSDDPATAKGYFRKSSSSFKLLGYENLYARSEGERGIALVQLNRPFEFVRIAEWMCRLYYLRGKSDFAPACTIALSQIARLQLSIEGKPILDNALKSYPKFERRVYCGVPDIDKPQVSGLLAFYSIAEAYRILEFSKREVKCLRTALRCEAVSQIDKNARPMVLHRLLCEIIPYGSKKEIKNALFQCMLLKRSETTVTMEILSFHVFSPLDSILAKLSNSQKNDFDELLVEIEDTLKSSDHENEDWWLAEIYLRRAKLAEDRIEKNDRHYLWSTAHRYGCTSSNHEVIFQAAHIIGFKYYEYAASIRDLAYMQFSIIKAMSSQARDFGRLKTVGINLFNLWRVVDYRRLSEYDLKAKQALMEGAKGLAAAGLDANDAAPIMILLICSVFDYKGPCTDWARTRALKVKDKIPQSVHEEIVSYL